MSIKKKLIASDVMLNLKQFPVVEQSTIVKDVFETMNHVGIGIACIVNHATELQGVLTDGDIRRKLMAVQKPLSQFFSDDIDQHMTDQFLTIPPSYSLHDAIKLMESKRIWDIPIVCEKKKLHGLLHLHHAIKVLIGQS